MTGLMLTGCGGSDSTTSGISERDAAFNRIAHFRNAMADRDFERACAMSSPTLQTYVGDRCVMGPVGRRSDWLEGPVDSQEFDGRSATETYGNVGAHTRDALAYNFGNGKSTAAVVRSVTAIRVGPKDWQISAYDARVP